HGDGWERDLRLPKCDEHRHQQPRHAVDMWSLERRHELRRRFTTWLLRHPHRDVELHAGHALFDPGQSDDPQRAGGGAHPMMAETRSMSLFRTGHRAFAGLRALARDRRGGPVIEFAMAAPALFLFLFGIIELGYAL